MCDANSIWKWMVFSFKYELAWHRHTQKQTQTSIKKKQKTNAEGRELETAGLRLAKKGEGIRKVQKENKGHD